MNEDFLFLKMAKIPKSGPVSKNKQGLQVMDIDWLTRTPGYASYGIRCLRIPCRLFAPTVIPNSNTNNQNWRNDRVPSLFGFPYLSLDSKVFGSSKVFNSSFR
jgi:hypothetical protein